MFVGTAVFAVIVVAGYFGYRQTPHLGAAQPPDSISRVDSQSSTAGAGVISQLVIADDRAIGKRNDNTQSVSTAAAQSRTPFAGAAPAAAAQPREDHQAAESRVAKVATVPAAHIKGTSEGRASEREQARAAACTESVAALGLCTLKPAQKTGAEAVVTVKPIIARSKAGEAGKTGRRDGRREDLCTDGAAALGLCMPGPTQGGK